MYIKKKPSRTLSNHGHAISQNNQSIFQYCHLIDLQDILMTVD
jgi:hypothetical protein